MTERQCFAGKGQPGFIFRVLLVACGLDAGLVAPFHLFTRTRGYFENATPLDFLLIGAGVITGIIILSVLKGQSFWLLVASAAGMAITAFLTIVQYPALEYASQTIPLVDILGIQTQPVILNYAIITCFAILLCGGMLDTCYRSSLREGGLLFPIALVLGATIHFFTTVLISSTTGLMTSLAASAIGMIALLGKGSNALVPLLNTKPLPLPMSQGRRVGLAITGIVSWLLATGLEIVAMLVFFGTLKQPEDLVNGSLLFSNMIAGAAIAALVALVAGKRRMLGDIIAIVGGGAGVMLVFLMASTGAIVTFPVIVLGIPLVLPAWYLVSELGSVGARGTTGVLLLVSWLVAGYLAFIPIKTPDISAFADWIYCAVIAVILLELGMAVLRCQLARISTIPT
jgi:hypothetical protein